MKNSAIIIGSVIGGVILGSTITLCMKPKSERMQMRKHIHDRIMGEIEKLKEQVESAACKCDESGTSCAIDGAMEGKAE